ncbi:MAG: glycosyltransferase [Clostridia bacterium]|nr:glycosyltransferase [Clostridia bacterium]
MNKEKTIAVLLPCYNEEATVEKVVRDFLRVLPTATVYVYNNNSTDRTAEIAAAIDPSRVVVRNEYRQGKGNVIRSMFRDIEADCYLMADGDDTYPAEHAPELCAAVLEEGYDMAIGDRLSSTYYEENKRPFHNTGNRLVKWLVNRLFHGNVKDIMTGYRAFSYAFVKSVPVLSRGFEVETEMTIHALDRRLRIVEIPVQYRDRPEGSVSKLNTVRDGLRVLKTIFFMCRDYRPMFFFTLFALLFFGAGCGFFIPVLIEYFQTGLVPRLPTLIVAVLLFLSALLSFATGNILDVIIKRDRQRAVAELSRMGGREDR